MFSETTETDLLVLYQAPTQVLDLAIQIVSFETQGFLERDFNSVAANLFPDFNQVVSEATVKNKDLPSHFETAIEQVLVTTWNTDNTPSPKNAVGSSQTSLS